MFSAAVLSLIAFASPNPHPFLTPETSQSSFEPRLMRFPDIHQNRVVFTYAGDLWIASTEAGAVAQRLTTHIGSEGRAKFSPDGSMIAFTGLYDGAQNVYVIPSTGGSPKRLTYSTETDIVMGWTPDGKVAFATRTGNIVPDQTALYVVDPNGGAPMPTPCKEFSSGDFFADGKRIAYNRVNSFNFNWRRYRGGTQGRISIFNLDTLEYSELPAGREQWYHPMTVGEDIYAISDKATGTLNLYRWQKNKATKLTNFTESDIRFPSTDGKSIVFENDGFLYQYDVASGKQVKLTPRILGDHVYSRTQLKNLNPYISGLSLSPSGARVAVEARGELFSLATKKGETRNMTRTSGSREKNVAWSPDGASLAYLSDASGEYEIYTQPQLGGTPVQLTTGGQYKFTRLLWTPDSKSLLFTTTENKLYLFDVATKTAKLIDESGYDFGGMDIAPNSKWIAYVKVTSVASSSVHLYDVETGKVTKVTSGFYSDTDCAFDTNGNYLYFVSNRDFEPTPGIFEPSLKIDQAARIFAVALNPSVPNPFIEKNEEEGQAEEQKKPADIKLDLTGSEFRTIALPFQTGTYQNLNGVAGGFVVWTGGTLWKYDMGAPAPTPIFQGMQSPGFVLNAKKTKFATMTSGKIQVADLQPGVTPQAGLVDSSNLEATIDLKQEWKQIYWDAWRYIRDYYYDPGMRGMDWNAIGKKYEAYLPHVEHRDELNMILGLLLGELGTGHAYITAPGETASVTAPRTPVGHLGADFKFDGDSVVISRVLGGRNDMPRYRSPLGQPGLDVKSGDYLVAIDGQPINRLVHPASLLVGKAGKLVTLTVNSKPGLDGARKIRVKPIASEVELRYRDWLDRTRAKVEELSGGKIGYMHIRDTAEQGSADFVDGFYNQFDKPALLIDERWNHGGYVQPWFVNTLARQVQTMLQPRHGFDTPDAAIHVGPKAMLINEYAGSGGDFFPHMFRKNGLGPLIGRRTWGGLVGINNGWTFVDRGSITAPAFSLYDETTNEIIAENVGTEPDIDIDLRPDLLARGIDPQLEAAVKHLLEELKKQPAKPKRTTVPKVNKKGEIGN